MSRSAPQLTLLSGVHSRVHFCRDAALVNATHALNRLVCRRQPHAVRRERYELYLGDLPLVEATIPGCGTCSTRLQVGYGEGVMSQESCAAVRDQLNTPYTGLKHALPALAPIIGLMSSGTYLVADFYLFPVRRTGNCCDHFWDAPDYPTELHFTHLWPGGEKEELDAPLYLAPTQRAACMDPARVDHYRRMLAESTAFPRSVALYLSGGVALLLDGHHKAATCAAEGIPVPTLVVFPVEETGDALTAALRLGKRLYLHHSKTWRQNSIVEPLQLRDGEGNRIAALESIRRMNQQAVTPSSIPRPEWGSIPEEYRTGRFRNYPESSLLVSGTGVAPDQIRSLLSSEMARPKESNDLAALRALRAYARLFPESKWISPAEREWLMRSESEFMY